MHKCNAFRKSTFFRMLKKIPKPYPPPLSGCSCCVIDSTMYLFGGHGYEGNTNGMYKLNIKTLTWSKIDVEGPEPSPRDKCASWSYENKFVYSFFLLQC